MASNSALASLLCLAMCKQAETDLSDDNAMGNFFWTKYW